MFYKEAVNYIENLEKFGSVYGLDTVRALLDRLGNPQNSLKFVHIAGTNGKGSTSCFITNILLQSGYRVGTFNSPSVFGYNERYLLDNTPIDDNSVAKYITHVAEVRAEMIKEGLIAPTAFEVEFAV
ncbi:MAG: bifunctional folylpolyglutamate synthase/dihydrofolate synthase, partial [Clostridia bacterium]|nr:bifunctional folylpolyglutamate synthase/dihydrofolate synthase [Clostridia bacterium]